MKIALRCFDQEFEEFIRITFARAGLYVVDQTEDQDSLHTILITSENSHPDEFKVELKKEVLEASDQENSKIIVWNRIADEQSDLAASLDIAVNEIKYNDLYNIRSRQFIKVVDDIRFILQTAQKEALSDEQYDMVFIYNGMEKEHAGKIVSMLETILSVHQVEYNQFSGQEFLDQVKSAMPKANFYVMYSRDHIDWMLNLHKEVWKIAGGAAKDTHYLLATDNSDFSQMSVDIANSQLVYADPELLALEIKIQYDSIKVYD